MVMAVTPGRLTAISNNPRSISNVNVGLFSSFSQLVSIRRNTRAAYRTERRKGAYYPAYSKLSKTKISMNTDCSNASEWQ